MGDCVVVMSSPGVLGQHLMLNLCQQSGADKVVGLTGRYCDLMDPVQIRRMFAEQQPDLLVQLAAYTGGIGANREYPTDV
jgi:GDP-L-fucose synthase